MFNEGFRQRKLMKRLKGEKENHKFESSLEVTSQQLRRLGQEDEHLKEILLMLSRFFESQKEKNCSLEHERDILSDECEFLEKKVEREKLGL